jgi:hypothetical protein
VAGGQGRCLRDGFTGRWCVSRMCLMSSGFGEAVAGGHIDCGLRRAMRCAAGMARPLWHPFASTPPPDAHTLDIRHVPAPHRTCTARS